MKKLFSISFVLITLAAISCNGQTNPQSTPVVSQNSSVEVYYFHMTLRCNTCKTVEAEARKNVEMLYPDQVKAGRISFTALNLEDSAGKSMGEKLGVNSQTLLIVKDDQKISITNEGFLYAVSQQQTLLRSVL